MEDVREKIKAIEEMIQVVLLAIPREIYAHAYYVCASQRATSDIARTLFLSLAEQEKDHEMKLKNIIEDLQKELQNYKCGCYLR